jgi:hypothetical protein
MLSKSDISSTPPNSDRRALDVGDFGRGTAWERAPEEWFLGSWALGRSVNNSCRGK